MKKSLLAAFCFSIASLSFADYISLDYEGEDHNGESYIGTILLQKNTTVMFEASYFVDRDDPAIKYSVGVQFIEGYSAITENSIGWRMTCKVTGNHELKALLLLARQSFSRWTSAQNSFSASKLADDLGTPRRLCNLKRVK